MTNPYRVEPLKRIKRKEILYEEFQEATRSIEMIGYLCFIIIFAEFFLIPLSIYNLRVNPDIGYSILSAVILGIIIIIIMLIDFIKNNRIISQWRDQQRNE